MNFFNFVTGGQCGELDESSSLCDTCMHTMDITGDLLTWSSSWLEVCHGIC